MMSSSRGWLPRRVRLPARPPCCLCLPARPTLACAWAVPAPLSHRPPQGAACAASAPGLLGEAARTWPPRRAATCVSTDPLPSPPAVPRRRRGGGARRAADGQWHGAVRTVHRRAAHVRSPAHDRTARVSLAACGRRSRRGARRAEHACRVLPRPVLGGSPTLGARGQLPGGIAAACLCLRVSVQLAAHHSVPRLP